MNAIYDILCWDINVSNVNRWFYKYFYDGVPTTPTIRFSFMFVGVQISHGEKQFAPKVASLTGDGRSTVL